MKTGNSVEPRRMSRAAYGVFAGACLATALFLGAGGPAGPTKCWKKIEQNCCTVIQGPNLERSCGTVPCPDLLLTNQIFSNRLTSTSGFHMAIDQEGQSHAEAVCKWRKRYCDPVTGACTSILPDQTVSCWSYAFVLEGCIVQPR